MKLRNLITGIAASAVAVTSLAASASAYDAYIMYADADWYPQSFEATAYPEGHADITTDGTYTVKAGGFTVTDDATGEDVPAPAEGAVVFTVEIEGLATALGCNSASGADVYDSMQAAKDAGLNITDVKVTTTSKDGTTQSFDVDQDKLIFADVESNGRIRIELYNEYGKTKDNPSFDAQAIAFDDEIAVTFTVTGLGGGAAADTASTTETTDTTTAAAGDVAAATDSSKGSPDTGIADVAAVAGLAVVAAGALVVAKKRG